MKTGKPVHTKRYCTLAPVAFAMKAKVARVAQIQSMESGMDRS